MARLDGAPPPRPPDGARYEIVYRRSTAWLPAREERGAPDAAEDLEERPAKDRAAQRCRIEEERADNKRRP